jgi:transglutaminase-like putative cysteine protease
VAARYLEPSPFIQSAHPDIVKRAESIVEGLDNAAAKALAIHQWVYRKVIKDNESSLPSALDVLRNMRGDCNEHTYLFTALARAAGIPTRVNIGLVYLEDAFYYHAWPSVYLGEWYELDPTFGQETVDASHIYLLEGEFATQLKLLGVIGQVDAVIEEQRY